MSTSFGSSVPVHESVTLRAFLRHLIPRGRSSSKALLRWPPNVFAVCAYILKLTGAYVEVLREWPPTHSQDWGEWVKKQGKMWRTVATNQDPVPKSVVSRWKRVSATSSTSLDRLANDRNVVSALLELVALADEASEGVGIPTGVQDPFLVKAAELLAGKSSSTGSTLISDLLVPALWVLPKQHTPRGGLTLRSLTHHLALHIGSEVVPFWDTLPHREQARRMPS